MIKREIGGFIELYFSVTIRKKTGHKIDLWIKGNLLYISFALFNYEVIIRRRIYNYRKFSTIEKLRNNIVAEIKKLEGMERDMP